jgi:hypothetical protein
MNVFSLLKRLGGFRRSDTDDIPAAFQPTRTDVAAPVDDRSDTTDFTPASWPSGSAALPPFGTSSALIAKWRNVAGMKHLSSDGRCSHHTGAWSGRAFGKKTDFDFHAPKAFVTVSQQDAAKPEPHL